MNTESELLSQMDQNVNSRETTAGNRSAKKRRLQVNLLSILLLIFACAVWIAYQRSVSETAKVQQQLGGLRLIARELVVEDPSQFAVVCRYPELYGELIWDVHIPNTVNGLRLCLRMDELTDLNAPGEVTPLKDFLLPTGTHSIELVFQTDGEQAVLTVLVDDKPVIKEMRPKDWIDDGSYSNSSSIQSVSKSFAADKLIALHKRRYMTQTNGGGSSVPKGPGKGIFLWVEPVKISE